MRRIKCCPMCGSTNLNPLAFYRPSTWDCLDCGYEGAFIIESNNLGEQPQVRYWTMQPHGFDRELHIDDKYGATDNWQRTQEDI